MRHKERDEREGKEKRRYARKVLGRRSMSEKLLKLLNLLKPAQKKKIKNKMLL